MKDDAAARGASGDRLLEIHRSVSDRVGGHPAEDVRGQHAEGRVVRSSLAKRAGGIPEYDVVLVLLDQRKTPACAVFQINQNLDQLVAVEVWGAQRRLVLLLDIGSQPRGDAADIDAGILDSRYGLQQLRHVGDQGVEKTMVVEFDVERADTRRSHVGGGWSHDNLPPERGAVPVEACVGIRGRLLPCTGEEGVFSRQWCSM
jgi:hypothetical protein